ncbi:MAG TPA: A24 family peptidase, partial [Acidimicrobiales bacterium]|nr:A24 family peptidase [Acidimicrobiales bacterium]
AVVTAAAFFLAAVRLGDVPQLAAYCVLAAALVVVSITDLRTGLVPRRIVYGAALVVGLALVAASATDDAWRPMLDALVGGAIGFFVLGAVWWISPKAMGFGDVRLAGLCGAALGWLGMAALYLGFVAAFVSGTIFGLGVLLAHGRRRFPFAPALGFGTMFGVLWGVWLGGLWLHFR